MIEPRTVVAAGIYRSGQVTDQDLHSFRLMGGVTVVRVNADTPNGYPTPAAERAAAQNYGLSHIFIPLPGFWAPDDADISHILSIVADTKNHPLLVHCQHGEDRTGMIVACYRIKFEKWSADLALLEAKQHNMSWASFLMRRYVREFADRLSRHIAVDSTPPTAPPIT